MRATRAILVASLLAGAAAPLAAATLRGRVSLVEKDGRPAADVSDAVVWVDGPKAKPRPPATATVAMKDKAFSPRVVVVPVGGTVEFPNQDPVFHNVFSVSGENRFDLDLYKKPKAGTARFERPGLVRVYCNIHPQMSAFVLVRDNPFWTRPSADGSFAIADLPAGEWVLKAWHERSGETSQPVAVGEGGVVEASVTLDASRFKKAPHKNKFGKDYEAGAKY